ncbi:hypothetical protein CAPTEDRAFT_228041 [Capitella teleta]|uniref:Uncharacterized protein n=1 Tax=Capitella teleta TaxID=283909 RepID=R7TNZ3_CAPTE|nr:hypothetical protein CAPTEDRAFT_228041 [Capitella teleta]|eukprot:ELT92770.1 hypothetical protein CAPTEDRAFT_228041 [Capitella teleta]
MDSMETESEGIKSRQTSNSSHSEPPIAHVKLQLGREISELSDLPDSDTDNFGEIIREQKSLAAQRKTQHEKWRKGFDEKKTRVLHRITDFTERKRTRIADLENVLHLTYDHFVHNRNTTDHEKTVERVILSRATSTERSGLVALSRENSRPPVISEERRRPMDEEFSTLSGSSQPQWPTGRQHACRGGEQDSFVRDRRTSLDLNFQESIAFCD